MTNSGSASGSSSSSGAGAQPWPPPPAEALSGTDLRRLTRQAMESHGGGRVSELITEVYSVLVAGGIAWLVVVGAIQAVGIQAQSSMTGPSVDRGWLGLAAMVLSTGILLNIFARLGPMALSAGHGTWWLPMPADRTGLLLPRFVALPAAGAVAGMALGAATGTLAATADLAGSVLWSMAVMALIGVVVALVCVAGQVRSGIARPRRVRPLVVIGDALVGTGPLLVLALTLVRPPALDVIGWLIPAVVVLAVAALALAGWTWRALEGIGGHELRQRGAVLGHAAGSVQALDTRELGRALSTPAVPRTRRRSASFSWVRGPALALIAGDAVTMARNPRHLLQVVIGLAVALVPLAAGTGLGLAAVGFVIGGYLTALATADGARQAEVAPVLDRRFPLDATTVRRVRVVWPLVVLSVWSVVVTAAWGLVHADLGGWVLLGLLAAPTLAGGTLRAAYRNPPDWGMPLIPGPAGPMPPGVVTAFSRGPDIVLLCLIPLLVAATVTGPTPVVVFVQMATSALALAVGCYVPSAPQAPAASSPGGQR